jgi:hypothetical protein
MVGKYRYQDITSKLPAVSIHENITTCANGDAERRAFRNLFLRFLHDCAYHVEALTAGDEQ